MKGPVPAPRRIPLLVHLRGRGPLHRRLYEEIRQGALSGRLAPGARLPSTRALARELGVSRTVVLQAYDRLAAEGYLESRTGSGTYLRRDLTAAAPGPIAGSGGPQPRPGSPPRLAPWARSLLESAGGPGLPLLRSGDDRTSGLSFDFRYGLPDAGGFPARVWKRMVTRHAGAAAGGYGDPAGSARLRRALAGYLARSRAVRCDPEQVLVVTGSQQGLDLVARTLVSPGDRVVLEDPHYPGAGRVFRAAGADVVHLPTDGDGLRVEELPEVSAALACVTPSHQFPSGGVLPVARRLDLLRWAEERDARILEDDYDSEFRYDAPPVEAIQALDRSDRVVYAGTLSKVLSPALRLGYLVLPGDLVDAFRAGKWAADRHSALPEQEALADFVEEGHFERHLKRARARSAARREALLESLARELGGRVRVAGAAAGVHVVAWLEGMAPEGLPRLVEEAARRDVGIHPVTPYYLRPPEEAGLLLGYAALDEDGIREGVRRLARALGSVGAVAT